MAVLGLLILLQKRFFLGPLLNRNYVLALCGSTQESAHTIMSRCICITAAHRFCSLSNYAMKHQTLINHPHSNKLHVELNSSLPLSTNLKWIAFFGSSAFFFCTWTGTFVAECKLDLRHAHGRMLRWLRVEMLWSVVGVVSRFSATKYFLTYWSMLSKCTLLRTLIHILMPLLRNLFVITFTILMALSGQSICSNLVWFRNQIGNFFFLVKGGRH